jgi:hypothetical protein
MKEHHQIRVSHSKASSRNGWMITTNSTSNTNTSCMRSLCHSALSGQSHPKYIKLLYPFRALHSFAFSSSFSQSSAEWLSFSVWNTETSCEPQLCRSHISLQMSASMTGWNVNEFWESCDGCHVWQSRGISRRACIVCTSPPECRSSDDTVFHQFETRTVINIQMSQPTFLLTCEIGHL